MRDSLTILAIVLIVVLTAALVGPYLVDWSAERGWIEARLTETLGAPAKIRGAIDLKLLPSPYFVVDDIEIGAEAAPFALSARKLRLEIAPASLLRGEIDFVEARLEGPHLALELSPDGALPLALPQVDVAGRFRFEKIAVSNGVLSVFDARNNRHFDLGGIDFEAEAESLSGPFKVRGALGEGDSRAPFHFATGPIENGALNLKLVVNSGPSRPGVDLDGRLGLRPGEQRFEGAAKFEGATGPLWRASGQLTLDAERAVLDQLELRVGEEGHELSAKGEAELEFFRAAESQRDPRIRRDQSRRLARVQPRFGRGAGAAAAAAIHADLRRQNADLWRRNLHRCLGRSCVRAAAGGCGDERSRGRIADTAFGLASLRGAWARKIASVSRWPVADRRRAWLRRRRPGERGGRALA